MSDTMGPTQFKAEVERLQREGKLPSLETLLAAIAETRAEFVPKILAARGARRRRALILFMGLSALLAFSRILNSGEKEANAVHI
jgi:hypothetical protein